MAAAHPLRTDVNWLLHRVALGLGEAEQQAMSAFGIGVREYVVLTALANAGPVRQHDLSHSLRLDKSAVTAVVDLLEEKNLVERQPDPDDRRARRPALTTKGRLIQQRAAAAAKTVEKQLLAELSAAERAGLVHALERLAFSPFAEQVTTGGSCL